MKRCLLMMIISLVPTIASAATTYRVPRGDATTEVRTLRRSPRTIKEDALQSRSSQLSRAAFMRMASVRHVYENADAGVRIRYPEGWTVTELLERSGTVTTVALFLSPPEGDQDAARENINLVLEELPAAYAPADYADAAIANERALFDDYRLLSSQDLLFAGSLAHHLSYTAGYEGKALAFDQVWIFRGSRVYVWTLAARPDTIDRYVQTFRQMLETMTFE